MPKKSAATSPKNCGLGQLMQVHRETHQDKWEKDHPHRQRGDVFGRKVTPPMIKELAMGGQRLFTEAVGRSATGMVVAVPMWRFSSVEEPLVGVGSSANT